MSSSGGSAAIRSAIEAKRAKIETPGGSLKKLHRDNKRKKAWWDEKIHIACLDEDGEPIEECAWKVPRRLLTAAFLQSTCLKCPRKVKIEYLKDQTTGEIVWPPDAQLGCHPLPWSYAVVAVEEKEVIDRSRDPFYFGDVQVMIVNVPLKTDNNQVEVTDDDLKAWLICGLSEEDQQVREAEEIVRTLEREAKEVEFALSRVGYMNFTQRTGFGKGEKKMLTDEEQAKMREEKNDALSAQREKMEEAVAEARAVWDRLLAHRRNTPLALEKNHASTKYGTCTYYVSIEGFEGSQLEDVVCAKNDWPGIKLATAHDGLPPWAGRGEIPDGNKSYIPRYTEHAVNMRAAQICRLQHGFGLYKVARIRRIKKPGRATPSADTAVSASAANSSAPNEGIAASNVALSSSNKQEPNAARLANSATTKTVRSAGIRSQNSGKSGEEGGGEVAMVGENIPFAGPGFSFYHGQFKEGVREGYGLELTEAGVYHGEYKADRRCGIGALHCGNGDHIKGKFMSETRFPEAEHTVNPYREGVPHGVVEIQFASGGTYRGEMKHGRITGKGEFVSCLGERCPHYVECSGSFVDGRLHGSGSLLDVVGQTWEGEWHEGEMDGEGRRSAPEEGEFIGDWVKGEWQGNGQLVLKGGNTYEGFFMDHGRSGPGMLFRGNVKDVYDPKSGSATKKSNRVYEGNWRAGELRAGSMLTLTKSGRSHCIGGHNLGWYNRAVDRIKRREQQVLRKTMESLDFYGRYQTLVRMNVEKKKARLFAKQANAANQDLIDDHYNKLDMEGLKAVYRARGLNIEQVMRVNGMMLDGPTSISSAVETLEQIAASRGTTSNKTLLSSVVQSRMEEAQECQQLVNITDAAAAAENAAHAQQAEFG